MAIEKGGYVPPKESEIGKICRLSSVVLTADKKGRERKTYLGWGEKGLPIATSDESMVSEETKASLALNETAGLPIKRVPYTEITAVDYAYTGPPTNFDNEDWDVEDLMAYGVKTGIGEETIVSLRETSVLRAIIEAKTPWQSVGRIKPGEIVTGASMMYTLFVADVNDPKKALVILFRPMKGERGNEIKYRTFVQNTVSKLLILDELTEPEKQRGYVNVAARFTKVKQDRNVADALYILKKLKLADFSDDWLDKQKKKVRKATASGLRIARALGLGEISDEELEEISQGMPDYNVEGLDLEKLLDLTKAMYKARTRRR